MVVNVDKIQVAYDRERVHRIRNLSSGRSPSWLPEVSELVGVGSGDVVVGDTRVAGDFLQQVDEAEPMKQLPSTIVYGMIVGLEHEDDYEVLVALRFAPPPGGQPPSLSVDNFA